MSETIRKKTQFRGSADATTSAATEIKKQHPVRPRAKQAATRELKYIPTAEPAKLMKKIREMYGGKLLQPLWTATPRVTTANKLDPTATESTPIIFGNCSASRC
jgi:hypothetical protein